jgi:Ca2+-binding RTX toxin-like protein
MADFTLTDSADTFPDAGQDLSGADRIRGLGGADDIRAGAGNDLIEGGLDADTLRGEGGNDTLAAGALPTEDVLDGGTGFDLAEVDYQNVINVATNLSVRVIAVFSGTAFTTQIDGIGGVTVLNCERITIGSGNANDSLVGGGASDTLTSLGGNDTLRGLGGNDTIAKTFGIYNLDGGMGWDTLRVAAAATGAAASTAMLFDARPTLGTISAGTVTSGTFRDFERYVISGTAGADRIFTESGGDILTGGDGADSLDAGGGADQLDGGGGRDTLLGGAGNDTLFGGPSPSGTAVTADVISAGDGNDEITLTAGSFSGPATTFVGVRVDGGTGQDTLELVAGSQPMDLTGARLSGVERLVYASSGFLGAVSVTAAQFNMLDDFQVNAWVQVTTAGNLVADGALGMTEIRLFAGGQRLDLTGSTRPAFPTDFGPRVTGGDGADSVTGSGRRDYLLGAGGNDTLSGAGGSDEIIGNAGVDLLAGGAGSDTFTFTRTTDSGTSATTRDVIQGFQVSPGGGASFVDRLNLSFIDAVAATAPNDSFAFIGAAAFTAPGQVRIVQSESNSILLVNTAGNSTAEMQVLLLGFVAASLTAADLVL